VVKVVFCLRRLPHLSLAEFQEYWLKKHGPLVRSHAETLGIRRYVQTHTTDNAALQQGIATHRGAPQAYDGVAELWWDSMASFLAASATPEGRAASRELLEDERRFIDHARSPLWVSEEHEIMTRD
jgi:uncharacterized protein (TIGR02118 family)